MAKGIKGISPTPSQKQPKKCVKTVALRSGRPEYICPASGGRGAVARLGRLPVRPEDVSRKMIERQIASPEEVLHPKQRMAQEAKPKMPKTLHFLDAQEAEDKTPDTLHFQDPQEVKVKKSITLFGDDSVVSDSIYVDDSVFNSDLSKAGPLDWWTNKVDAAMNSLRSSVASAIDMGIIGGTAIAQDIIDNPWETTADVAAMVAPIPGTRLRTGATMVRWARKAEKAIDKAKKAKRTISAGRKYRKASKGKNVRYVFREKMPKRPGGKGASNTDTMRRKKPKTRRTRSGDKPKTTTGAKPKTTTGAKPKPTPTETSKFLTAKELAAGAAVLGVTALAGKHLTTDTESKTSTQEADQPQAKQDTARKYPESQTNLKEVKKEEKSLPRRLWWPSDDDKKKGESGKSEKKVSAKKKKGAKPLVERTGKVSERGKATKKKAKSAKERYRQIKRKEKWESVRSEDVASRGGKKKSRYMDTDKLFAALTGSQRKSISVDFSDSLGKSAAYVKPFGDRVLHKKMSLKAALDKVPWWMQDDLLTYLRKKKKR